MFCVFDCRFTIALPARGRTIMGRAAATVLLESVPELVRTSLLFKSINAAALRAHVLSVRRECWLCCLSNTVPTAVD